MAGLNAALQLGLAGLQSSTAGLATTNHNIANVNTPGFARQEVQLTTNPAVATAGGFIGTGVRADSIKAFRDRFIETRLAQETGTQGNLATLSEGLQQLEQVFNEDGTSNLASSLNQFFNAFADLANAPGSLAARAILVQRGQGVAAEFNSAANRVQQQSQQTNQSVNGLLTQVNQLAERIGALNEQISLGEGGGKLAHDLRDQRGEALRQLSALANISSYEDAAGTLVVNVGAGRTLVAGSLVKPINAQQGANNTTQLILGGENITAEINSGKLGGLLTLRDQVLPRTLSALDGLAAQVVQQVNQQHAAGQGLDGSTGLPFFTALPGGASSGAARAMALNSDVAANPNKIAASSSGAAGDNQNALALAGLQQSVFTVNDQTGTFAQLYANLVGEVGGLSQDAQQRGRIQAAVVNQVQNQRDSISGVSLDEEAVNLIKYQRSFEASARVLRVIDELTSAAINIIQ